MRLLESQAGVADIPASQIVARLSLPFRRSQFTVHDAIPQMMLTGNRTVAAMYLMSKESDGTLSPPARRQSEQDTRGAPDR